MDGLIQHLKASRSNSRNHSISSEADLQATSFRSQQPSKSSQISNQPSQLQQSQKSTKGLTQQTTHSSNVKQKRKFSSSSSSSSSSSEREHLKSSTSSNKKSQEAQSHLKIIATPNTPTSTATTTILRPPILKNPQQLQSPQKRSQSAAIPASALRSPSNNKNFAQRFIDESVCLVMNVFKAAESHTPFQEKASKVRAILEGLIGNIKMNLPSEYMTDQTNNSHNNSFNHNSNSVSVMMPSFEGEDHQGLNQQIQLSQSSSGSKNIKHSSLGQSQDQTNKTIVHGLESRLLECERARTILRTENEAQQLRILALNKEIEGIKTSNEVINILRESQQLLERNNRTLHESLKKEEARNQEQQRIFQAEIQDVRQIVIHLKQQLAQQYQSAKQ